MGATRVRVETQPTVHDRTEDQPGDSADDLSIYSPPSDLPRIVRYSVDDDPFIVDWAPPQS